MTFRISPGNSACISHFDHCLFRLIGIALLSVIFTRTQGLGGGGEYVQGEARVQGEREGEYWGRERTGGGGNSEGGVFYSQIMKNITIPYFLTVIQITAISQRNGKNSKKQSLIVVQAP